MPQDQQNLLGQAKSDWETLKREYDKAPSSDKEKLLAKLKESELNLESAKNLYKPVPVVSSITGTVIMKNVEIGNNVSLKQPLFEIADLNRLIVKSAVFERYVSKISLGQKVPVILHSFTDKPLIGTLSVITPGISTESRTSAIEVAIEAKDYIKPGMTASLEINLEKKQNAVTVPLDAVVINASGEKTIFTVQNDTAKLIKITTGVESDYKTEVLSGLKERDLIVVLGQDNLADGIRVKIAGQEKAEKPKGKNKK
jgi:RND family efflux transporter MFP subunit